MKVYFDNAATTPVYPEVIQKMTEVLRDTYGNPSSTHAFGRKAKSLIEYSRKQIAKQLNASPSEIIFTSGGTEANNLILRSCVHDLGVQVVISSLIEHHAVLHTLEVLAKEYPIKIVYVNLTNKGVVDLSHLEYLLQQYTEKKVLVSLMHINNEIGNILPLKEVTVLCKQYNAYFHSDTVQSVGHYPIDLEEIPADFITASAHKFHGPKGIGFAFIRKGIALHSSITGGEQEKGLRAGTEAVHNIVGMEVAFSLSYTNLDRNTEKLKDLKRYFIKQLKHHFPEALLFQLDLKGIACSKGSACQSGSVQTSHVLSAFLSEEALQYPSLRCSFSIFNTVKDVDFLIESLKEISHNNH